jgi:hypothetical protein
MRMPWNKSKYLQLDLLDSDSDSDSDADVALAMKSLCSLVLALASVSLASCGFFAEQTAAPKRPGKARNEPALKADAVFWNTLHSGDYDGIGAALDASTAAYLNDPFDAVTAAHVGWLQIWKLAEHVSRGTRPASRTTPCWRAATFRKRYHLIHRMHVTWGSWPPRS